MSFHVMKHKKYFIIINFLDRAKHVVGTNLNPCTFSCKI